MHYPSATELPLSGDADPIARLKRELAEALEYQTAISDVLAVISHSPSDLQPVLDTIAQIAERLCGADRAQIFTERDGMFHLAAHRNTSQEFLDYLALHPFEPGMSNTTGRAVLECRTIHAPDVLADPTYDLSRPMGSPGGARLSVPLLHDGRAIGVITVSRAEPRAFTDRQIDLITTFASQAVIAIENARLFEAEQTRTRELSESLEYQTATSDVLGVISRSPAALDLVFQAILAKAVEICESHCGAMFALDGKAWRGHAFEGGEAAFTAYLREPRIWGPHTGMGRVLETSQPIHIVDAEADRAFSEHDDGRIAAIRLGNVKTFVIVPLLRDGRLIGAMSLYRQTKRAFTDRQIDLVSTFARQAVIAIENARLFEEVQARTKELQESLEYQTAISEVLGVISRSPNDLQSVLNVVAQYAARVCMASNARVFRVDGDRLRTAAAFGDFKYSQEVQERGLPVTRGSVTGRAVMDHKTVHVADLAAETDAEYPVGKAVQRLIGHRTALATPLLRDGVRLGAILIQRMQVNPFTDKQIRLLETFADQAVIAIENARLLDELQTRQKELTESLDQQTATADVLKIISKSPSDLQPVLNAIVATAARLCEAQWALVWTPQDGKLALAAHSAAPMELVAYVKAHPMDFDRGSVVVRAALDGKPVHIADVLADPLFTQRGSQSISGMRTCLGVPLRQDGRLLGVMSLARDHVRPFSQPQIDLVATFAEQAVIAMNNAHLFEEVQARTKEVTEALEYQTAMSEVLEVISKSPDTLQPVLDTIVGIGARLCEAEYAILFNVVGEHCHAAASNNTTDDFIKVLYEDPVPIIRGSTTGRAALERQTIHVEDVVAWGEYERQETQRVGKQRTVLSVPLLRNGTPVGVLTLMRSRVAPFSDKQIKLVETFADQAVIAINNVGLFEEVQARTKDLARSVDELRSLGEVGRTVSSSLDMPKVLQTVLENACRMANAGGGTVYAYDTASGEFRLEAGYNMSEEHIARVRAHPMRLGDRVVGECAQRREAVQIEDLARVESADVPLLDILARAGVRALLAVPLLHQGEVVGALVIRRSYPGAFAPETVRLLEAFAAQSAIAVNNARLFAEVEEKGEQLRLASQHKSQFLANMSHELRTPLNAILGYTELMQDGIYGALPEKAGGVLGRVQTNGQHLLGLINAVLDLSKIEAGQLQLDVVEYGMPAVVEAVVVATESLAIEKKLKLETNVAADLPRGLGDERRITQVLLNLVGNAIKFTEQGAVTIGAALAGDRFLVSVADTGPGIPTAELERVFEEFHQVDNSNTKAKGGTGLGLAIAKRIIEMHGGCIWVESTPGQGATFRFELPVSVKLSGGGHEQAHTRH